MKNELFLLLQTISQAAHSVNTCYLQQSTWFDATTCWILRTLFALCDSCHETLKFCSGNKYLQLKRFSKVETQDSNG